MFSHLLSKLRAKAMDWKCLGYKCLYCNPLQRAQDVRWHH